MRTIYRLHHLIAMNRSTLIVSSAAAIALPFWVSTAVQAFDFQFSIPIISADPPAPTERPAKTDEMAKASAEFFLQRGIAQASLGNHRAAIVAFDQAIELYPDYIAAYQQRAKSRQALGDLEGATADRNRAQELIAASAKPEQAK